MVLELPILGFVLILIGFLVPIPTQLKLTAIGIGLVLLFVGAVIMGLTILFQFIVDWYFIILPLLGIIAFFLLFKKETKVI